VAQTSVLGPEVLRKGAVELFMEPREIATHQGLCDVVAPRCRHGGRRLLPQMSRQGPSVTPHSQASSKV
jgi:hypothetical protein